MATVSTSLLLSQEGQLLLSSPLGCEPLPLLEGPSSLAAVVPTRGGAEVGGGGGPDADAPSPSCCRVLPLPDCMACTRSRCVRHAGRLQVRGERIVKHWEG